MSNMRLRFFFGEVTQLAGALLFKREVIGSNPIHRTKLIFIYGLVVQLVRILECHSRGREFKSRPVRERVW